MTKSATLDPVLIARCLDGNAGAWEELVSRYQALVYSIVRSYFRDSDLADDVFQDVWLELYRRLDTIEDVQAIPAWLITVARRKCGQALGGHADWEDVEADNISRIDHHIDAVQHRFWIEQAMAGLDARDRALIEALYFDPDQPSYEEIAARLDMPVASIGPTRARCLAKLKRRWEGDGRE